MVWGLNELMHVRCLEQKPVTHSKHSTNVNCVHVIVVFIILLSSSALNLWQFSIHLANPYFFNPSSLLSCYLACKFRDKIRDRVTLASCIEITMLWYYQDSLVDSNIQIYSYFLTANQWCPEFFRVMLCTNNILHNFAFFA